MFAGTDLRYRVGRQELLAGVSLTLVPGRLHVVLGPNGAGKSTLLRLFAGDLAPSAGTLQLNGRPLAGWSAREIARQRAVLPQSDLLRFAFSASQVVALGRLPCRQHAPEQERRIVHEALALTDATHLAARSYVTLSGGERARVQMARVLTQIWEPVELGARYLLLDEPTASLDLAHQHQCLQRARAFAAQGVGVLAVLHDPNLAMAYADEVTLLCCGEAVASGAPEQVLTAQHLERIYGVTVELLAGTGTARPHIAVRPPASRREDGRGDRI